MISGDRKTSLPVSHRINGWIRNTVLCLLSLAALAFPFSVAATNITLGTVLGLGLVSGLWWQGAICMWHKYRWLCIAALLYWGLMVLGLAWSGDRTWGMHVLGRQWFWLLLPIVMHVLHDQLWQKRFLALLSLGLTAHLVFCVLQMLGYVTVTVPGSTATDATGHIGHIGFGAVYGMWAGFLLHWGWRHAGVHRIVAWLLAIWAWTMIFLAQGRSGYLVALAILLVILWKQVLRGHGWRRTGVAVGFILLMIAVLAMEPGKMRLLETWQGVQAGMHGDISHAEIRWSLWVGAMEVWKAHPVLGVGTGGFPVAAAQIAKKFPELNYGVNKQKLAAHPHNMYLLALTRWGIPGIITLELLLFLWIQAGWRLDWNTSGAASLIVLPGIALAVQGLSAPSLEEHFEDILAVLLLGCGLAWYNFYVKRDLPVSGADCASL